MEILEGFPCQEVEFHKDLSHDEQQEQDLLAMIADQQLTDLVVISHGWNNDIAEARELYTDFFKSFRQVLNGGSGGGLAGRKLGIMAVLWPSKKFTEKELIPGGAASAADKDDFLIDRLKELEGAFDGPSADGLLQQARSLVGDLQDKRSARKEFGRIIKDLMKKGVGPLDTESDDEIPPDFFDLDDDDLIEEAESVQDGRRGSGEFGGAADVGGAMDVGGTAGTGGAAAFRLLRGPRAGALRLLNFVTYYQMKKRAGRIGEKAVYPLLRRVKAARPDLKLHLIGHSFGGRLVAATARGGDGEPAIPVSSITLLQAAFSHNGFAENFHKNKDGYFRTVVEDHRVTGPIAVTHTENDKAVGLAYPLAQKLNRDDASAFGGPEDRFGGIGRNGAQHTPEADAGELLEVGGAYAFEPGRVSNLKADAFVSNHGDVAGPEVAHAAVSVIATT